MRGYIVTKKELKELIRETIREELAAGNYIKESSDQNKLKGPINKHTAFTYDDAAAKVAAEIFENADFKKMLSSAIDNTVVVYDEDVEKMIQEALRSLGVSENNLETVTSMVCGKLEEMTDKLPSQARTFSGVQSEINKAGNIGGKRVG
jgi:O-phosphoseryl-tRNA(Cys) synthetase